MNDKPQKYIIRTDRAGVFYAEIERMKKALDQAALFLYVYHDEDGLVVRSRDTNGRSSLPELAEELLKRGKA